MRATHIETKSASAMSKVAGMPRLIRHQLFSPRGELAAGGYKVCVKTLITSRTWPTKGSAE